MTKLPYSRKVSNLIQEVFYFQLLHFLYTSYLQRKYYELNIFIPEWVKGYLQSYAEPEEKCVYCFKDTRMLYPSLKC